MNLTEAQRRDLAERIDELVLTKYRGLAKAAYEDAGVNSGTFASARKGNPLRADKLVAIVAAFWPETEGDWRRIQPPLRGALLSEDMLSELDKLQQPYRDQIRAVLEDEARRRSNEGEVEEA